MWFPKPALRGGARDLGHWGVVPMETCVSPVPGQWACLRSPRRQVKAWGQLGQAKRGSAQEPGVMATMASVIQCPGAALITLPWPLWVLGRGGQKGGRPIIAYTPSSTILEIRAK
jgi:hypothetical protein